MSDQFDEQARRIRPLTRRDTTWPEIIAAILRQADANTRAVTKSVTLAREPDAGAADADEAPLWHRLFLLTGCTVDDLTHEQIVDELDLTINGRLACSICGLQCLPWQRRVHGPEMHPDAAVTYVPIRDAAPLAATVTDARTVTHFADSDGEPACVGHYLVSPNSDEARVTCVRCLQELFRRASESFRIRGDVLDAIREASGCPEHSNVVRHVREAFKRTARAGEPAPVESASEFSAAEIEEMARAGHSAFMAESQPKGGDSEVILQVSIAKVRPYLDGALSKPWPDPSWCGAVDAAAAVIRARKTPVAPVESAPPPDERPTLTGWHRDGGAFSACWFAGGHPDDYVAFANQRFWIVLPVDGGVPIAGGRCDGRAAGERAADEWMRANPDKAPGRVAGEAAYLNPLDLTGAPDVLQLSSVRIRQLRDNLTDAHATVARLTRLLAERTRELDRVREEHHGAAEARAHEHADELQALGTLVQQYQPAGSPPPGGLYTLAGYVLHSLAEERAADVDRARGEEREKARARSLTAVEHIEEMARTSDWIAREAQPKHGRVGSQNIAAGLRDAAGEMRRLLDLPTAPPPSAPTPEPTK